MHSDKTSPPGNRVKIIENQYIYKKRLILMTEIRGKPGYITRIGDFFDLQFPKIGLFSMYRKNTRLAFHTACEIVPFN
jgi:hypothetical protein